MHDKFFKENLSDVENAKAFLKTTVPANVLAVLDLSTLEVSNSSFITKDLDELFSDIVFTCALKNGEEAYCSILVEHKSYKDTYVAFQLGSYIFAAYRDQIKQRKPLKVVIPILFYHSDEEWEYKPVSAFLEHMPTELKQFVPMFETIFFDVKSLMDEEIHRINNVAIAFMFIAQKHSNNLDLLLLEITKVYENLQSEVERNFFTTSIVYIFELSKNKPENIDLIKLRLDNPVNQIFMTLYETLIQEGQAKGLAEGKAKGLAEGKAKGLAEGKAEGQNEQRELTVCNSFNAGIEIALIANIVQIEVEHVIEILKKKNLLPK